MSKKINQIIFICRTCEDTNKQLLGEEGFELKNCEFESLTEAYEHMLDTPMHHYIEAQLVENENDKSK